MEDSQLKKSDYKLIVSDFEKDLECPVCFNIPRSVPIPSCPAGHIVCTTCKPKVKDCPTCRRNYPDGLEVTSSLAASLIDKVPHRCKFSDYGCDVRLRLKDITKHEAKCPERTVKCPRRNCRKNIQMKAFYEHVLSEKICGVRLLGAPADFLYKLSEGYLDWDGELFRKNDEFDTKIDKSFKIIVFRELGMDFYLSACYVASKKAFLFSVFLPSDKESAEPYNTKFIIENPSIRRQKMVFEGQVLSIEEIDSILHPEVISKSWCVNYEAVKPFLNVENISENNNHVWEVKLPIHVQVTRYEA